MRWIFLSLLFANAGYFAWGYYQQSHRSYELAPRTEELPVQVGKKLVLYSESRQASKGSKLGLVNPAVRSENKSANYVDVSGSQCMVLGPFSSASRADELQQKLFSLGVPSRERSDSESSNDDYWVHIPPRSSRQSAIRLLRDLQGQGIDSFVITQGELANGISLGLFSRESSANDVSRRLLEAGYETSIKMLPGAPDTFWLEIDLKEMGLFTENFWSDLLFDMGKQYKELKMLEKNCKSIASNDSIY